MNVLIAGCGYLGLAAGRRFADQGARVFGIRRSEAGAAAVRRAGLEPLRCDLLNPAGLDALDPIDLALLAQAPSRPHDDYRSTYYDGTRCFLGAFSGKNLRRIVLISSTSVYGTDDGSWVDESTLANPERHPTDAARLCARTLLDTENLVLSSGFPSVVLRLSGIYGPGRNAAERLRHGVLKPAWSCEFTNRMRLEDIVSAVELLASRGAPGEVYLGCDDRPVTQGEFYGWLLGQMGISLPDEAGRGPSVFSGKRCSNRKIKELGLQLRYPSYKEGYATLV